MSLWFSLLPPTFSFQHTSTVKILFHSSAKNKQKSPIKDSISHRIKAKGHITTYKLLKMSLPFSLSTYHRIPFHSLSPLPNTTLLLFVWIHLIFLLSTPPFWVTLSFLLFFHHLCQEVFIHTCPSGFLLFPSLLCSNIPFSGKPTTCTSFRIKLLTPLSIQITLIDFSLQCLPSSNTLCTCMFIISIVFPLNWTYKFLKGREFFLCCYFLTLSLTSSRGLGWSINICWTNKWMNIELINLQS